MLIFSSPFPNPGKDDPLHTFSLDLRNLSGWRNNGKCLFLAQKAACFSRVSLFYKVVSGWDKIFGLSMFMVGVSFLLLGFYSDENLESFKSFAVEIKFWLDQINGWSNYFSLKHIQCGGKANKNGV